LGRSGKSTRGLLAHFDFLTMTAYRGDSPDAMKNGKKYRRIAGRPSLVAGRLFAASSPIR